MEVESLGMKGLIGLAGMKFFGQIQLRLGGE